MLYVVGVVCAVGHVRMRCNILRDLQPGSLLGDHRDECTRTDVGLAEDVADEVRGSGCLQDKIEHEVRRASKLDRRL